MQLQTAGQATVTEVRGGTAHIPVVTPQIPMTTLGRPSVPLPEMSASIPHTSAFIPETVEDGASAQKPSPERAIPSKTRAIDVIKTLTERAKQTEQDSPNVIYENESYFISSTVNQLNLTAVKLSFLKTLTYLAQDNLAF